MFSQSSSNNTSLCLFSSAASKFKPARVAFEREKEDHLSVTIETERFRLQSCTLKDEDNYRLVFGDPKVMEKNATGAIDSTEELHERMQYYADRWEHNDPLNTSLAVFDNETDAFVGQVALYASKPKTVSFFYLFRPEYWNTKHLTKTAKDDAKSNSNTQSKTWAHVGTETVSAVVLNYIPALKAGKYQIPFSYFELSASSQLMGPPSFTYTPLEVLQTTARLDNIGSTKILEAVGMEKIEERYMFGNGMRGVYRKIL